MKRRRSSRPAARAARVLTLLATMAGALLVPAHAALAAGTTYYVNCSAAGNGNGTQSSPWNSVSSVAMTRAFSAFCIALNHLLRRDRRTRRAVTAGAARADRR